MYQKYIFRYIYIILFSVKSKCLYIKTIFLMNFIQGGVCLSRGNDIIKNQVPNTLF